VPSRPPADPSELAQLALADLATAVDLMALRGTEVVEATRVGAPPGARFPVFSISKTVTAVTVLALVDAGELELTTRVASLLPRFGVNGKDRVTVADVLSHTGGFPDVLTFPEAIYAFRDAGRAQAVIQDLPFRPDLYGVGTYHGVSYGVLGAVVEAAAGERFADVCRRAVLDPLEMRDTSWGVAPDVASVELTGPDRGAWDDQALRGSVIPAGNLWSTAPDIARVLLMLRGGGQVGECRVLSPASAAAMIEPHAAARGQAGARAFGYGLLIGSEPGSASGRGATASDGCYGHAGATASQAWYDPRDDLALVALTNGCPDQVASDERFSRLSDRARVLYSGHGG
jgi:CubicO group peptidase (beta-lactamase class C family)